MRFAAAFTLVLPAIAVATAVPRWNKGQGSCNTGSLQCCKSVQSTSSEGGSSLTSLLGVALGPISGLIGLNCTPLDIIGVAGNSCSAQPVCCTDNQFNGLVSLGCTPINLNL